MPSSLFAWKDISDWQLEENLPAVNMSMEELTKKEEEADFEESCSRQSGGRVEC